MQINYNKDSISQRGKSIVTVKVKLQLSWRLGMFNKECDFIIVIKIAWAIRVSIYMYMFKYGLQRLSV